MFVRETHHDDIAVRALLTPAWPTDRYVMKIDLGQSGEALPPGASFLRRIRFPSSSTPALNHFWMSRTTRPVCYPVLDELQQAFVRGHRKSL